MQLPIYQVAAFTESQFGGNPAAVVPLSEWLDDGLMQKIAAENNLSETAFFVGIGDGEWEIRWFTPKVEVPLCGHATLASAAVIDKRMHQGQWPIRLRSASGVLSVDRHDDRYELDFPANPPQATELPQGFEAALGHAALESYLAGDIFMVLLEDQAAVASLQPDFAALAKLTRHGAIATAAGDTVDFVSRFFAPSLGIDEDPVTGAAHCVLTPFWSERLGKRELAARQISSRVGVIECIARGERVGLRGRTVFFLDGTINVAA
ncbi:MAG: PhzF family phenazine biosynthesis protein [Woeseiaceae bacterium]|nr:PhzF family phenazine biosynthesis protein [Woeseiaceae bacterium]